MSKENKKTLEVYEKSADKYLERAEDEAVEEMRHQMFRECFDGIPEDAKIFEVGSAGGKDASYLRSLGYKNITVSDVADMFLKTLKEVGFDPLKFNLLEDDFPDKYGYIICWAVLMHFTKDEAKAAIRKMFGALEVGGKLLTCVKTSSDGQSEEWKRADFQDGEEVYFSYWSEDEFRKCLEESGFKKVKFWGYGNWIDCLAEK